MSVATRPHPIAPARATRRDRPGGPSLPIEIAFLREFGVPASTLHEAVTRAGQQGVDAATALLASGGVTDLLFYRSLARYLDAPFATGRAALAPAIDARRAIATGRVELASGTWLMAPAGADLILLLKAARVPDLVPRTVAITTPAQLEALVLREAGAQLARRASLALPTLAPHLSARGAVNKVAALAAAVLVAGVAATILAAPALGWTLVDLVFMAGIAQRFVACASGLSGSAPAATLALSPAALPSYTVLVPLYHEANMASEIVQHLGAIDYPSAKLEILLLVEADDVATRAALAATARPPTMRIVTVPPGAPRTKPRALNLGLALARGTLTAVFDAEDRPDPDQLRLAAARFAAADPSVACLQGRLAIRDHHDGLLRRLFALEYAVLFDLHNVGMARLDLPLPLGGTSNHFRGMGQQAPKVR